VSCTLGITSVQVVRWCIVGTVGAQAFILLYGKHLVIFTLDELSVQFVRWCKQGGVRGGVLFCYMENIW
jgi:hypothetical protein